MAAGISATAQNLGHPPEMNPVGSGHPQVPSPDHQNFPVICNPQGS